MRTSRCVSVLPAASVLLWAGSGPAPRLTCAPPPLRRPAAGAPITKSSSVGGEICSLGRNDDDDDDKKRRPSFGVKVMGLVGLGKKSQSASQLNPEGQSQRNQSEPADRLPAEPVWAR